MISERPLPLPDDATLAFWEACRRGELRMQRCAECKRLRWPPRPMCPGCQSFEGEWIPVSGRGTIYSFVIAHAPLLPAFQPRAPMPVVLVALEEDPTLRLIGNLVDPGQASRLAIGAPVEVAFEDLGEVTLPQWRLR
jgi:uncharacterized OB-fold protein